MILTMLAIGVAMFASLANYHVRVSIHRPLGIAILILVVVLGGGNGHGRGRRGDACLCRFYPAFQLWKGADDESG